MKILWSIFFFINSISILACSDIMRSYPIECNLQDKFQKLESELKKIFIDINHVNGTFIPFTITDQVYNKSINDLLSPQEKVKMKSDILAMLKVESLVKRNYGPILTADDLNRYHGIFASFNKSSAAFDLSNDKFRTLNGLTNPRTKISCDEEFLNNDFDKLIGFYDLETIDGYPLLLIENVKNCENDFYQSGEIVFYKGPSVKNEMNRWLTEFNDTIRRYKNNQIIEISPYEYFADMYRWFLAIHPYQEFNENVAKSTLIWAAINLQLPLPQIDDQIFPFLRTRDQNRKLSLEKINHELNFLSDCLIEYNKKLVSPGCKQINL